jgi:hypothetical protein
MMNSCHANAEWVSFFKRIHNERKKAHKNLIISIKNTSIKKLLG